MSLLFLFIKQKQKQKILRFTKSLSNLEGMLWIFIFVLEMWLTALITVLIGSARGLIVKMAHCVDLSNKRRSYGDPWDWPHCSRDILVFPLVLPFQGYGLPYRGTPRGLSQDYMTARLQLQTKDKLTTCLQWTQLLIYGVCCKWMKDIIKYLQLL